MAEKNFKSRIVQKHDVEANWKKAINFVPIKGEIIIYDIDENYDYERFKIGDGKTAINDLPFSNDRLKYVNTIIGETVVVDDSSEMPLNALSLYGKTTQNGTPTAEAPVDLIDIPAGDITINITDGVDVAESATVTLTSNLRGIPVASGGNYTDANGQQWVCDEIDIVRGVLIKRIDVIAGDKFAWNANSGRWQNSKVSNPSPEALNSNEYFKIMCNIASFGASGAQNTCRPGNFEYAGMVVIYVPETTDMTDVIVYYQCAPEEIPLADGTPMGLHGTRGTMSIANDGGACMKVSYVTDAIYDVEIALDSVFVRKDLMIVSDTEPESPEAGTIWFDIS